MKDTSEGVNDRALRGHPHNKIEEKKNFIEKKFIYEHAKDKKSVSSLQRKDDTCDCDRMASHVTLDALRGHPHNKIEEKMNLNEKKLIYVDDKEKQSASSPQRKDDTCDCDRMASHVTLDALRGHPHNKIEEKMNLNEKKLIYVDDKEKQSASSLQRKDDTCDCDRMASHVTLDCLEFLIGMSKASGVNYDPDNSAEDGDLPKPVRTSEIRARTADYGKLAPHRLETVERQGSGGRECFHRSPIISITHRTPEPLGG
ncbi:hypothetical protein AAG570_008321 [Ranatra chinensis]|uniref:Uncharacterized protein n=1 Tax=Ranatra chinensis TaxID=642074 RepID=A0ABD0XSU2_9HEMI